MLGNKNEPKISCMKFSDSGTSRARSGTFPLKQQKKAPCMEFLSRTSQGHGRGYPDVRVPDVPEISGPRALSLGCFFRPENARKFGPSDKIGGQTCNN